MKRIEDGLRDLCDIKCTNVQIIGVPEEEEKKKGTVEIFEEIIVENFPNMRKEIIKSRSTESPKQDKSKEKHAKTHSTQTIKNYKYKETILKAASGKQKITYKGIHIRLTADFSENSANQKGVAGHI